MANYLIASCDGLTSYIVNPGENTINTGSTYYFTFTGGTEPICAEVISEDISPIDDGVLSAIEYNNCLTCLQSNDYSFVVSACTVEGLSGPVSSLQFNEIPLGQSYRLCPTNTEFGGCLCFKVIGLASGAYPFIFGIAGPFLDCNCTEPPRSAGTEYEVCEVCFDGTVVTVYNIQPPHPVYTDGYGTPVTQLNMVVLGGPNGLNS